MHLLRIIAIIEREKKVKRPVTLATTTTNDRPIDRPTNRDLLNNDDDGGGGGDSGGRLARNKNRGTEKETTCLVVV